MLSVFYDGRCGLCAKEIAHYRTIASDAEFEWLDIFDNAERLQALDLTVAQALKLLYAHDDAGRIYSGVDTFLQIWQRLPKWYWRGLAKLLALPGIYHVTVWVYRWFAKWRFKRLGYCNLAD